MKKDLENLVETIKKQLDNQRKIRDSQRDPMSVEYAVSCVLISRLEWEYIAIRNILENNVNTKVCDCPGNKHCIDGGMY